MNRFSRAYRLVLSALAALGATAGFAGVSDGSPSGHSTADTAPNPCKLSKHYIAKRLKHRIRYKNLENNGPRVHACDYADVRTNGPNVPGAVLAGQTSGEAFYAARDDYRSHGAKRKDVHAGKVGFWSVYFDERNRLLNGYCKPKSGHGFISVQVTSRGHGYDWHLTTARMRGLFRAVCSRF